MTAACSRRRSATKRVAGGQLGVAFEHQVLHPHAVPRRPRGDAGGVPAGRGRPEQPAPRQAERAPGEQRKDHAVRHAARRTGSGASFCVTSNRGAGAGSRRRAGRRAVGSANRTPPSRPNRNAAAVAIVGRYIPTPAARRRPGGRRRGVRRWGRRPCARRRALLIRHPPPPGRAAARRPARPGVIGRGPSPTPAGRPRRTGLRPAPAITGARRRPAGGGRRRPGSSGTRRRSRRPTRSRTGRSRRSPPPRGTRGSRGASGGRGGRGGGGSPRPVGVPIDSPTRATSRPGRSRRGFYDTSSGTARGPRRW